MYNSLAQGEGQGQISFFFSKRERPAYQGFEAVLANGRVGRPCRITSRALSAPRACLKLCS